MKNRSRSFFLLFFLIFAFAGYGSAGAQVEKTPVVSQGPSIKSVKVIDKSDRQIIDIEADMPLVFTMYKPSDPFRVVVELTAANLGEHTQRILVDKDSIFEIVPKQIKTPSPMARFEIGLTAPIDIAPRIEGNHLLLEIPKSQSLAAAVPASPPVAEAESVPAIESVSAIEEESPAPETEAQALSGIVAVAAKPKHTEEADQTSPADGLSSDQGVHGGQAEQADLAAAEENAQSSAEVGAVVKEEKVAASAEIENAGAPAVSTITGITVGSFDGRVNVEIATDKEVEPDVYAVGRRRIIVDVPGASPAVTGAVESVVSPIKAIRAGAYRDKTRVVIDLYETTEYDVSTGPAGIIVSIVPPAAVFDATTVEAGSEVAVVEEPKDLTKDIAQVEAVPLADKAMTHAGKRISLDFQDADVVQILRLLADVGGYNLAIHPEVKGRIPSLNLKNVPWDQALDIVLKLSGQKKVIEGNILRVAPPEIFASEQDTVAKSRDSKLRAGELYQRAIALNYANAQDVYTSLRQGKIMTTRGRISVDKRMNMIIIQDVQESIDKLMDLVKIIDIPKQQVLIEARMVTIRTSTAKDLGIDWSGTLNLDAAHGNPTGVQFPNRIGGSLATNVGFGGIDPNMSISLGSIADALTLDVQLAALEELNGGRTLSNPRIMTMDNEEAEVKQGTQIPYKSVSQEGTQTEFVDATLSLKVTPKITPGGYIQLKLLVTRNAVGVNTPDGPSIDLNEVTSQALVKDGDTIVIGGIYTKDFTERETKIPILGDIPGFGWLFKSSSKIDEITELLIFITPRIVKERGLK